MATQYPNAIDTNTNLPLAIDNITEVKAASVNILQQAILAIENCLGINPQSTFTSSGGVSARLNNFDTQISALNTAVANVVAEVETIIGGLDGEHILLGTPSGGFDPGITPLTDTTPITEAINTFNSLMSFLAPAQPQSMSNLSIDAYTSIPMFSGKIAHNGSSASYYGPFAAGSMCGVITKTQAFTLSTHDTTDATTGFSDGDKGIIQVFINGVAATTFNLGTSFDDAYRSSASGQGITYAGNTGSNTPPLKMVDGYTQIYSIKLFNNFPLWQKGVIHLTSTALKPGYNSFQVSHTVGSSTRTSQTYQLFYDSGSVSPSYSPTPTLAASNAPTHLNWLSGIRYLTTGEVLTLATTINNTFANTYLQAPVSYSFTAGLPNSTSDLSDPALTVGPNGSATIPDVADHIAISKAFTISTTNQQTINGIANVVYLNTYGATFTGTSASQNLLINTYNSPASNGGSESFVDEFYRLVPDTNGGTYPNDYTTIPSSITGQWTSTAALTNGNAQVFNNALVYPALNFFTGYTPSQQSGSNYSGFNNSNSHSGQVYYRAMYSAANPRSSGTLTIGGISLGDMTGGSPNVKIELKLPGSSGTGWLDLSKPFNSGTFTGITGDGCRSSNSGSVFGWSVGTFSTSISGYMYLVRITLFNTTKPITSLAEAFS